MIKFSDKSGFTLVEILVAIVILTVAIFSMYAMLTTAIRGNATARSLTTASNWARYTIEELLSQEYEDIEDSNGNGCTGLGDFPASDGSYLDDPIYKIYWNVAYGCTLAEISDDDQQPKHIRVIVTRNALGLKNEIVFNYIKQNTM